MHSIKELNLSQLADMYGTDKNYKHKYTKHYEMFFSELRRKKINLLEIGIGGKGKLVEGFRQIGWYF